ncbi:MAG: YIP1 family protein [Chloroflexota bacterium]
MTNKQIEPVRNRNYQITQRTRPRGLWGQVWLSVLQPAYFFRTLPLLEDTRTWLWAAVLILALTGISAVRQDALLKGNTGAPVVDFGNPAPSGDTSGGRISKGGFAVVPIDGGGGGGGDTPIDTGIPPNLPTDGLGSTTNITTTWTTALLAATTVIIGWFVLTVILSEVTLFNGRAPSMGQNFQIAVWASIPFALMAGLQLIYYAAGGKVGGAGLSGLLSEWGGYDTLPAFWRNVVLSLTSRLTLFWVWSLILIYIGARNTLHGKRWASVLVVMVWATLLVVVPVVTGAVKAPEIVNLDAQNLPLIELPGGDSTTPQSDGAVPGDLSVPGETNQTGELQGRFADQQSGDSVVTTPDSGAQIEPTIPQSPSGEQSGTSGESQSDSQSSLENSHGVGTPASEQPTAPPGGVG